MDISIIHPANSTSVNISLINTTLEVIIENQTNPVEITVS